MQMQKYWVDPDDEDKQYSRTLWKQFLTPLRTHCFYCRKPSPIIHLPYGTTAFGNPRYKVRGAPDFTEQFIMEMAEHGWKVQLNRSYCPDCKGLGRV